MILTQKVADLQKTVFIEKSKRKHDKPLFDDLKVNYKTKVIFFSSIKIETIGQHQQKKEQAKNNRQTQKEKDKQQK